MARINSLLIGHVIRGLKRLVPSHLPANNSKRGNPFKKDLPQEVAEISPKEPRRPRAVPHFVRSHAGLSQIQSVASPGHPVISPALGVGETEICPGTSRRPGNPRIYPMCRKTRKQPGLRPSRTGRWLSEHNMDRNISRQD